MEGLRGQQTGHIYSERPRSKRRTKTLAPGNEDFARKTIDGVIEEFCRVVKVSRPTITFSEVEFATHKAQAHHENQAGVLKDIHESNSGKNRALTCDGCFSIILFRPQNLGILQDPKSTVEPITTLKDNTLFLLLHELMHVKLRDSDFKKVGTYHTQRLRLQFNRCAGKLGVTKYRE